ncbi:hypothetical protein CBL_05866 [Carabus blaptoides fortunei]
MAGTVMIRRCFNDEVVAMTTGRCWAGRVARPTLGRRSAGAAGRTARRQRRAAITQSQAAAVCVRPDMSIYNIHASATTSPNIYIHIYRESIPAHTPGSIAGTVKQDHHITEMVAARGEAGTQIILWGTLISMMEDVVP